MSNKNIYKKIGYRFAEELQLVAEEKWIIQALAKIKKQRNSLQIERLQLESLRSQHNSNSTNNSKTETNPAKRPRLDNITSTSTIEIMKNAKMGLNSSTFDTEMSEKIEDYNEVQCNSEELNLMVENPVYSKLSKHDISVEEDETDDEDGDNVLIDINMLMNAVESD